jgi:predicted GNAT superfamily acetyltransferase
MSAPQPAVTQQEAWADYRATAQSAGVDVRIASQEDAWATAALFEEIWGARVVEAALVVALEHAGGYAAVAVDQAGADVADASEANGASETNGGRVLGAAVGFIANPLGTELHSHVAGVRPGLGRPGIGRAIKLHQRAWCLDRGVTEVTWTFDPLIARNAHINVARLGTEVDEYLVNFYGAMSDGINAGQASDRALVRWHLERPYAPERAAHHVPRADATPRLVVATDGSPVTTPAAASAAVTLAIPPDIEGMRTTNPAMASAWRIALRDALAPLLGEGWRVTGFEPRTGYLVERTIS